jgi:class 3 adenylate cyclase
LTSGVAKLDSTNRADLPDSAFAYVDSKGKRRLPINDEAHVRNALARFEQVSFEDERARERARKKLLTAAKKYGIVPVGFITGQLQSERQRGAQEATQPVVLPTGFVTLMMTDIEGSTALVHRLGDGYRELIDRVRTILQDHAVAGGGVVVETRADELFAAFEQPGCALDTAVAIQRDLGTRSWGDGVVVKVRIGIHSGEPTLTESNYIGMDVHAAARICAAAHGGQVVVSSATRQAAARATQETIRYRSLGAHRLRGLPEPITLYQLAAKGLAAKFPPPRKA